MDVKPYIKNLKRYSVSPHKVWEMKSTQNVYKLDWNEATQVLKGLREYLSHEILNMSINYYPNTLNYKLFSKLTEYTGVPMDNVLYYNGSDDALDNICQLLVSENILVGTIESSYDNFRIYVEKRGGRMCYISSIPFFKRPSVDRLIKFVKQSNVSVFYLISPHNPLGFSYTYEELLQLIKELDKINVSLIIDQAYLEFESFEFSYSSLLTFSNVFFVRTFSKAFGLASLRLGYVISSKENIELLKNFWNPKSINQLAQNAAMYLLDNIPTVQDYVLTVRKNRGRLETYFAERAIDYVPSVANYVLFKIQNDNRDNLRDCFEKNGIFIRYLSAKVLDDFIRTSIGDDAHTDKFISVLEGYLLNVPK